MTIKILQTGTANQAIQTKSQVNNLSSTPIAERYRNGVYIPANELVSNASIAVALTHATNRWLIFPFTPEKSLRIASVRFDVSSQSVTLNNVRLFLFRSNPATGFPSGQIFVSDAVPTDSSTSANKIITTVNYQNSYSFPVTDIILNKNERYWWAYYSTTTFSRVTGWTNTNVNTLGSITTTNINTVTCYQFTGALNLSQNSFSQANTTSVNITVPKITIVTSTI